MTEIRRWRLWCNESGHPHYTPGIIHMLVGAIQTQQLTVLLVVASKPCRVSSRGCWNGSHPSARHLRRSSFWTSGSMGFWSLATTTPQLSSTSSKMRYVHKNTHTPASSHYVARHTMLLPHVDFGEPPAAHYGGSGPEQRRSAAHVRCISCGCLAHNRIPSLDN